MAAGGIGGRIKAEKLPKVRPRRVQGEGKVSVFAGLNKERLKLMIMETLP